MRATSSDHSQRWPTNQNRKAPTLTVSASPSAGGPAGEPPVSALVWAASCTSPIITPFAQHAHQLDRNHGRAAHRRPVALAWTTHDDAGAHAECAERTARGRRPYEPDRVMPT